MVRYLLTTDDQLIFRDGRPFGESGVFGGNSLNWPFPQTLAGMVRTAVGFTRDPFYFENSENADKILETGIARILPMAKGSQGWESLMPVPGDLVLTRKEDDLFLTVNPLIFKKLEEGSGTDIANRNWLIPSVDLRDKPAKEIPFFFFWHFYDAYLKGEIKNEQHHSFEEMGISPPMEDLRIHNAIDANTFATQESKLFSNAGFYLKSKNGDKIIDLAIGFDVLNATEDISGDAWLGGERKRVVLNKTDLPGPTCPDYFKNRNYLKLILTTHGDFGGWAPQWLKPDLDSKSIDWVKLPGTDFEIRLCSACVNGWDGVSGWDYKNMKPKKMKKLVRPGSVFVIEIKNPGESEEIAGHFWGNCLDPDNLDARNNGYGQCIVGNAIVEDNQGEI